MNLFCDLRTDGGAAGWAEAVKGKISDGNFKDNTRESYLIVPPE